MRERLAIAFEYDQFEKICVELAERRKDEKFEDKFGWYFRYRKDLDKNSQQKLENLQKKESEKKPVEDEEDMCWNCLFDNEK